VRQGTKKEVEFLAVFTHNKNKEGKLLKTPIHTQSDSQYMELHSHHRENHSQKY